MKYFVVLSACCIVLELASCRNPVKQTSPPLSNTTEFKGDSVNEKFEDFFSKFKADTNFQKQRIRFPLRDEVISIEEDNEYNIEYLEDVTFSFSQNDWFEKICTKVANKSPDTTVVSLRGVDTGLWMDHYFAKKSNGQWELFKLVDNSN